MDSKSKSIETTKENEPKIISYPKKPFRGEVIKKTIDIITNLRQITFKEALKGKHIMIYDITFIPEIKSENEKEKNFIEKKILRQLKEDLMGTFEQYFLYGNTIFICTKKSKEKITLETKFNDKEYQVIFTKVYNNIDCTKISHNNHDEKKIKIFIENIIKNIITSNNHIIKFGDSNFYDYYDVESCPFRKRCKIWNGYGTNVLITEKGILLQIIDKRIIITGLTAYEKMEEISKKYDNEINKENCKKEILSFFKGKTLITQYGNYRSYKITDIDFDKTTYNTTFNIEEKNGEKKSYL